MQGFVRIRKMKYEFVCTALFHAVFQVSLICFRYFLIVSAVSSWPVDSDQRWIVDLAADRAPFICQSQSINLYLPSDVDKWDLHMLHWTAWERGLKSLYYCRSKSVQRAAFAGESTKGRTARASPQRTDYDECLACQ